MADKNRVVVTGLGLLTPIGLDEERVWRNLLAGRSAIAPIEAFDASECKVVLGAEVDNEALAEALKKKRRKPRDRVVDFAVLAAEQALESAGLIDEEESERQKQEVAVVIGSGVGPAQSLETSYAAFGKRGARGIRPTAVPRCMANSISAGISIEFKLTGPNFVTVAACTSSTNAIGVAFRMVQDGYAEAAICGGAEAYFQPFYYSVWNNLGVLSKIPDPATAYRPFDVDRDGCLLGEGAGMLVIESLERATARGARIRGEILGYGESSDAGHITSPSVEGQSKAITSALASAGVTADDIGFINAHGTATPLNDVSESRSIIKALGERGKEIPVGANKSYFGHLLGASGAVESIVTLLGLEKGQVPPNLNLDRQDPECEVLTVGRAPLELDARIAMKNSFGFGGGNGVLILQSWD